MMGLYEPQIQMQVQIKFKYDWYSISQYFQPIHMYEKKRP